MSAQLRITDGEQVLSVEASGPGPVPVVFAIGHAEVRISRTELATLRSFLEAIDD